MIDPNNFQKQIEGLREIIYKRLKNEAEKIIEEEVLKILDRVKIITSKSLDESHLNWFIMAENKND